MRVSVATTRRARMRGLIGHETLGPDEGLLLPGARSVHTFGMRFPITVAWLDREGRVIAVKRVPPRRITLPRRGAQHVLECSAGAAIGVGDLRNEALPGSHSR